MSGTQIPVEFDFGDAAQQAQALSNALAQLIRQTGSLRGALGGGADQLLKDLRDAGKIAKETADAIARGNLETRFLNAGRRGAGALATANEEARIREVGGRPLRPQIQQAGSLEDLKPIETALKRDIDRMTASRRELRRLRDQAEGDDRADIQQRLNQLNGRLRDERAALKEIDARRQELGRVVADGRARSQTVAGLQRQISYTIDPEVLALRQQLAAARARPAATMQEQVTRSSERNLVSELGRRQSFGSQQFVDAALANAQSRYQLSTTARLNLLDNPEEQQKAARLAAGSRRTRQTADELLLTDAEFRLREEKLADQRKINSLQRQIRQAQQSDVLALQEQLAALRGKGGQRTPAQEMAIAVNRLVTGAQAFASAAANPGTRQDLIAAQQTRMGLGNEAFIRSMTLSMNPNYRADAIQAGVLRTGLQAETSLRAVNDPVTRAAMLQSMLGTSRLRDDVADARLDDPEIAAANRRRRNRLAQQNAIADREQDPGTRQMRLDNARDNSREFLFGDGGQRLFETQARLMAQYAVLGTIATSFTQLTTAVVDYDRALRNLQAISGSTDSDMKKLSSTIIGVSRDTKFTAVELADVSTVMAQAGLSIREINQSLNAVALLATATGASLATSADVFTSAMGVFRLRASESVSVANQMVAALNLSKLTMDQLALGIQYASNVAAESNISFTELTAALATMANQGIRSGSTLGTGLTQLILDLETPSEKLRDRLRDLGLTTDDVNVRTRGLAGAMTVLRNSGFSVVDAMATLEVRSARAFAALSRGADDMRTLEDAIRMSGGAAEANRIQMQALSNAAIQFTNNLKALAVEAASGTVSALVTVLQKGSEFLQWMNGSSAAIGALGNGMMAFATVMGGMWLVRVTGALGLATTAFAAMQAAAATTGLAMMALGPAAGIATVALTALTTAARFLFATVPGLALLTGAGVALAAFADGSRAAAAETQNLRQAVEDSRSAYDERKRTYESIGEEIVRLNARQSELVNNETNLRSAVEEVRSRFRDLDTTMLGNITTFNGLIGAMQRMRAQINSGLVGDLIKLGDALRASIGSTEAQIVGTQSAIRGIGARMNYQSPEEIAAGGAAAPITNPVIQRALALGTAGQTPDSGEIREVLRQLAELRDNTGRNSSDNVLFRIAGDLMTQVSQLEGQRGRLAGDRQQVLSVDQQRRLSEIRDTPGYQEALLTVQGARGQSEQRRQVADLTPEELAGGGAFAQHLDQLRSSAAAGRSYLAGLPEADRRVVEQELQPQIAALETTVRDLERQVAARVSGRLVSMATVTGQRTEREINNLLAEAARPDLTPERRAEIDTQLNSPEGLFAQFRRARLEGFTNQPTYREQSRANPDVAGAERTEFEAGIDAQVRGFQGRFGDATRGANLRGVRAEIQLLEAQNRETRSRVNRRSTPAERAAAATEQRSRDARLVTLREQEARLAAAGNEGTAGAAQTARNNAADNRLTGGGGTSARLGPLGDDERRTDRFRNIRQDEFRIIERNATEGEREARRGLREGEAFLDFASRRPDLVPEAIAADRRRQQNERAQQAEERIGEVQGRRTTELERLVETIEADATAIRTQIAATEQGIASAGNATVRGNLVGRFNELQQQLSALIGEDGAGGLLGQVKGSLDASRNARDRANGLRSARQQAGELGFVDALTASANNYVTQSGAENPMVRMTNMLSEGWREAERSMADYFYQLASGTAQGSQSIQEFGRVFIANMLKIASSEASKATLSLVLRLGTSLIGGVMGGGAQAENVAGGGVIKADAAPAFEGLNFYTGGPIPQYLSGGGRVRGMPHIGRDNVPVMAAPGEYMVNRRGREVVGDQFLSDLNRGQMNAVAPVAVGAAKREPDTTNVYVMSPNQKPSLGPRDVLAIISDDIATGGQTRKLIKSVQSGSY